MSSKQKKIILLVALVVVALIYFFWDSTPAKKLRGVDEPVIDPSNTDKTFKVQVAAPVANDSFPLTIGSRGDNVKRLQQALNVINSKFPLLNKYDPLVTDGVLGQDTYKMVLVVCGTAYWGQWGMTQEKWNQTLAKANGMQ